MEVIPVKTRILEPPQDDLLQVLSEAITELSAGDVVAVSSKVVAIWEGRCIPLAAVEKSELVASEADVLIPRDYWSTPLTITRGAFIGNSGVDESNAHGHYVLLPENPFASAERIHAFLCAHFAIAELGVIITDSHSIPLRRGAMGISIGFWGFKPIINHVGEADLFGRELKIEVTNLVDGLAAAANVVMGETDEAQPVAILRAVPNLTFTMESQKNRSYMTFDQDTFRVLYERFIDTN